MFKIICSKTGIEFNSTSKRVKNHPRISLLLSEAHERGAYGQVMNFFDSVREEGRTDIEGVLTEAQMIVEGREEELKAQLQVRRAAGKARNEVRKEREKTNAYLRKHGYCWVDSGFKSEEDADFFGGFADAKIGHDWYLMAPDGREVTVAEALHEIEASV